jgi:hypothetical protein
MSRPSDRYDAQWRRIAELAAAGDLVAARDGLTRLGEQARAAGDRGDASGALRLAATLSRTVGEPTEAVRLAEEATALAGDDPRWALPAHRELAESRLAAGDPAGAAAALSAAAELAGGRDLAGLKRAEAYAWGLASEPGRASAALDAAGAGDPTTAAEVLADRALLATAGGDPAAEAIHAAAVAAARTTGAPGLLAGLELAAASRAIDAGDLTTALSRLRAARVQAREAVAPLAYVAAAVAESAVAERLGDDEAAYAPLATGYATLGDLLGRQVSAATFTPHLVGLRDRLGADRFAAAKSAYEARRRAATAQREASVSSKE